MSRNFDFNNAGPQFSSNNSDPNIMPLGKYKGRLIQEVMQIDPGHIQWFLAQSWFRERYPIALQVIINNGAASQETPDIEIKPTVSDDYPAVLRQMRFNGSEVLFVGSYTGVGAAREQFVRTMATAGIRVVFAEQVQ